MRCFVMGSDGSYKLGRRLTRQGMADKYSASLCSEGITLCTKIAANIMGIGTCHSSKLLMNYISTGHIQDPPYTQGVLLSILVNIVAISVVFNSVLLSFPSFFPLPSFSTAKAYIHTRKQH